MAHGFGELRVPVTVVGCIHHLGDADGVEHIGQDCFLGLAVKADRRATNLKLAFSITYLQPWGVERRKKQMTRKTSILVLFEPLRGSMHQAGESLTYENLGHDVRKHDPGQVRNQHADNHNYYSCCVHSVRILPLRSIPFKFTFSCCGPLYTQGQSERPLR